MTRRLQEQRAASLAHVTLRSSLARCVLLRGRLLVGLAGVAWPEVPWKRRGLPQRAHLRRLALWHGYSA